MEFLAAISDSVGLVGVTFVLLAFSLLNMNKLTSHNLSYQFLNLTGSILLLFSLCFHINLASIVIEIAWMLISVIGIYRAMRVKQGGLARPVMLADDKDLSSKTI